MPTKILPLPTVTREVAERLNEVRARLAFVAIGTGAAMATVAVIGWLSLECIVDWLAALPWLGRFAIAVAGLSCAGGSWWWFAHRPRRVPIADDAAALLVERALPEFRGRLIATVQLARMEESGASRALVNALVRETTSLAGTLDFRAVVKTERLAFWVKAAAAAVLCAAALWIFGGKNSVPLVTRALLWNNPVPRKTQISGVTGSRAVAVGDDVRLKATAGGQVPLRGTLQIQTTSGRKQDFPLDREGENAAHFSRLLQSVQEPFEYRIALGDAETETFRIKVKPRPTVASVECRQIFPAYTQLPPQRRAVGDLKVLPGSKLELKIRTSRMVKTALMQMLGADGAPPVFEAPMRPDPKDESLFSSEITVPAKDVTGLTFYLADDDGVESRGGAVYRIELVPDAPPTIRVLWPDRREELLTARATMLLAFEAKDDFGVAKVRLHFAVDWAEGAPHQTIDLDLGAKSDRVLAKRFDWKMSAIQPPLSEGQTVDYWLEAQDANDVTGPGIATMEHFQIRIVSEADKRADLANRLSDTIEGLNDVRQRQEEVNKALGEIIFEKPPANP